ncbi:hypothetical protein [Vulcanisaeta thermophila]|uniref:hypothetical protein n=1 Tax=Vulcanisaeta thermophila TaxID=867917 RepID=UPI000853B0E6|nr:hypothetical protein [Vulcanisaeta thermophila]
MSIRDELLKLLKEDETFRLAVMGLLGIMDIQSSIRELINTVNELAKNQLKTMEILNRTLDIIQKLAENQNEIWKEIRSIKEENQKIWQEINRVWQEIKALKEGQEALREGQARIWREVVGIRRMLERMTLSIEEEANEVVQYYLRQRGIAIETRPTHLNTKYEFDIYGSNGQLTIVGEARTRAGPAAIRRVVKRVEEAVKSLPDKFPGRVIVVVYCLRAVPGALEEANNLGVWLLESGRERNQPRL